MATKVFDTKFGDVVVCNAMFDLDGTTLDEGVEIKFDGNIIEVMGYRDIEEMTIAEIEEIIATKG